ncbi:MAG: hypothetical protein CAK85_02300 [Spartobacteria bacterium AMD-G5]|nr:MAG: hypothetical protein CAK85_02300 [Spartobacteria bacterium AMD-G5]
MVFRSRDGLVPFFSAIQRHCGRIWREWDGALSLKFGPTRRSALQFFHSADDLWPGGLQNS